MVWNALIWPVYQNNARRTMLTNRAPTRALNVGGCGGISPIWGKLSSALRERRLVQRRLISTFPARRNRIRSGVWRHRQSHWMPCQTDQRYPPTPKSANPESDDPERFSQPHSKDSGHFGLRPMPFDLNPGVKIFHFRAYHPDVCRFAPQLPSHLFQSHAALAKLFHPDVSRQR